MLKMKTTQISMMIMSSYVGYIRDKRILAYVIVERNSNQNRAVQAGNNNVIVYMHPTL